MFNHLRLVAQQTVRPEYIELFLRIKNVEHGSFTADWNIKLPPHLRAIANSRPLAGSTNILPSEGTVVAGSWTIQVLPLRNNVEPEIEAEATLSIGTDFKQDSTRETLSVLLNSNRV